MQKTRIDIEFLGVRVDVIVAGDVLGEYARLRKRFPLLAEVSGECDGLCASGFDKYPGRGWIILEKGCTIAIANHEIQHCVDDISSYYDINDTEFRAYLFEYISRKIFGRRKL